MKPRDVVKRKGADGSPTGPALEVVNVGDYWLDDDWIGGAPGKDSVAYLHDGSWEFVFNLIIVGIPEAS